MKKFLFILALAAICISPLFAQVKYWGIGSHAAALKDFESASGLKADFGAQFFPLGTYAGVALKSVAQMKGELDEMPAGRPVNLGIAFEKGADKVLSGGFDKLLKDLSVMLKAQKRKYYIRIGYEFDLTKSGGNYDIQTYPKAYRHIYDLLKREGVDFEGVWCSSGNSGGQIANYNTSRSNAWWPGLAYVDIAATDMFDVADFSRTDGFVAYCVKMGVKKFMIGESAPRGLGVNNTAKSVAWFDAYFGFINSLGAKGIDTVYTTYFNLYWPDEGWITVLGKRYRAHDWSKWGDSRLGTYKPTLEWFKHEMKAVPPAPAPVVFDTVWQVVPRTIYYTRPVVDTFKTEVVFDTTGFKLVPRK